jgi:hypothetical protein
MKKWLQDLFTPPRIAPEPARIIEPSIEPPITEGYPVRLPPIPSPEPVMMILGGISHFGGKIYPHGALDEESALAYADRRGYVGRILAVSGEASAMSAQTSAALAVFRWDQTVAALYGFSGGGYNIRHILDALTDVEKTRIELVVVLGAPNNPAGLYRGNWELVYKKDPPAGHMAGPATLLAELAVAGGESI